MNTDTITAKCQEYLEEMKVKDIEIIDLENHSLYDCFIIATCTSSRHLKSTADHILFECKSNLEILGAKEVSDFWVAIGLDTVVVHLFLEDVRKHYDLESLWLEGNQQKVLIERKNPWEMKNL